MLDHEDVRRLLAADRAAALAAAYEPRRRRPLRLRLGLWLVRPYLALVPRHTPVTVSDTVTGV